MEIIATGSRSMAPGEDAEHAANTLRVRRGLALFWLDAAERRLVFALPGEPTKLQAAVALAREELAAVNRTLAAHDAPREQE
jgi:hypothetical protein